MLRENTSCSHDVRGALNYNFRLPKRIFLWLCLLAVSQVVAAQVFPLPEQNPEWIISTNGLNGPSEEHFSLTGEFTSVGGEEWANVQVTTTVDWEIFIDTIVTYVGAYFVDGDQVYFKDPLFGYEGLLYDFSAQIGDTFFIVAPVTSILDSTEVTVIDREVTTCGDKTMRTIYLRLTHLGYDLVWKEGMGAVKYPFISRQCMAPNCDVYYEENRLMLAGKEIIVDEDNGCLTSDDNLQQGPGFTFNLYPNPTNSGAINLTVDGLIDNGTLVDIILTNQLGQRVKQWKGQVSEDVSTSIDLEGVVPGTYFVVLRQGNKSPVTRKLVVAD